MIPKLPDAKTVSGFRKFLPEYMILILLGGVIVLFAMVINLNSYIRTDFLQQQIRSTNALQKNSEVTIDFLNWQRWQRPIRPAPYDSLPN